MDKKYTRVIEEKLSSILGANRTSFIGHLIHPVGVEGSVKWGGWKESIFKPFISFTLVEFVIIWCKVQVIISPLHLKR